MAVTAELRLKLFANDVAVAESDDAELWRRVFTAIQKGTSRLEEPESKQVRSSSGEERPSAEQFDRSEGASAVGRLASELKIDVDDLVGSADPTTERPYVHLNAHNWEALKKVTPERGSNAIAPVTLVGTLLALWFDHAKLGTPTVNQCSPVLDTIKLPTNNIRRGIENCPWLRLRGDAITVNPSQKSRALRVARAYCTMKGLSEE